MSKGGDVQAKRRAQMEELIRTLFHGNSSAFARAAGKKPSQIQDMRNAKSPKAFGEKVARSMEANLRRNRYPVPIGCLEHPDREVQQDGSFGKPEYSADELGLLQTLLDLPTRLRMGIIETIMGGSELQSEKERLKAKHATRTSKQPATA